MNPTVVGVKKQRFLNTIITHKGRIELDSYVIQRISHRYDAAHEQTTEAGGGGGKSVL
jgi:hypothetical protein